MKNKVVLLALLSLFTFSAFAQNVLDGVYVKEHTLTRIPLTYPYLREADVMWSKRIWRVLDAKEKINLPLALPKSSTPIRDRKNLLDLLLGAVKEGSLTAYDASDIIANDEFLVPVTLPEIQKRGGQRLDTTTMTRAEPPYETYDTIIKKDFDGDAVVAYELKEDWFFDKQRSVMDVRIIGIAPLIYAKDERGNILEGNQKLPLCWFYYPECRKLLANAETFNRQNDAERRSFDDIFQKRMFNSLVIKESNVYDRKIRDYKIAPLDQVLESDRVKQDIINMEHDMWEY